MNLQDFIASLTKTDLAYLSRELEKLEHKIPTYSDDYTMADGIRSSELVAQWFDAKLSNNYCSRSARNIDMQWSQLVLERLDSDGCCL